MKYPITPEYLESAPDPLVDLYTDLEEKILKDICRRFKLSGEATESAIAQMKILQERGMSLGEIEKFVRKTLNLSEKELDEIINRAVDRNRAYYDRLIEKTDILNAEFRGIDREIETIRRQTHDELSNLTQSLGFAIRVGREVEFLPIAKTYQKVLDDASAQVLSGAVDYNTAIRDAVKRLTDSGLQTIDYASGWHNRVDVAVRRAVMTGVSQLSSQYAEQAAEELETDLREVTAHVGARDTGTGWQNHKSWQGKVYSVKTGDKYPSIYTVCGWGMVDGLEGVNCRHHHFPFVEGVSERTYTDEQLANIDPPPFAYQGKTYSAYEATQKQRQIERAMRKSKREFIGYEAAGQTETAQDSAIRLRRLSQEYKAFSKAAGLRTQPERARVDVFGRSKAVRAVAEAKKRIESVGEAAATRNWHRIPVSGGQTETKYRRFKEPKTVDQDVAMTNPGYKHGGAGYTQNCQRCVPAYVMRRRGFDVIAKPATVNEHGKLSWKDRLYTSWNRVFKGANFLYCTGSDRGKAEIITKMAEWGDGSIAEVHVLWTNGEAHVFVAEQIRGHVRFIDPQTGDINCERYFTNASNGGTMFARIDNLEPTELIEECIKNRGGKPW